MLRLSPKLVVVLSLRFPVVLVLGFSLVVLLYVVFSGLQYSVGGEILECCVNLFIQFFSFLPSNKTYGKVFAILSEKKYQIKKYTYIDID